MNLSQIFEEVNLIWNYWDENIAIQAVNYYAGDEVTFNKHMEEDDMLTALKNRLVNMFVFNIK